MNDLINLLPDEATAHLRAMAAAAEHAGAALQDAFQRQHMLTVTEKTLGDFVSSADRSAEVEIARVLTDAYPTYGWLGEETGARPGTDTTLRWVVDPLDGTTNFLKGLPHWCVSIALCQEDEVLAGLVYDPHKRELFTAERENGAYLNGTRIWASAETNFQAALFATGVPAGGRVTYLQAALEDLARLMPLCAGIRRGGAAALDLAYVAAGRIEGYWERNLGAWDIAAGVLLAKEAGAEVHPLWKDQSILSSGSFVVATSPMIKQLRTVIT